MWLPDILQLGGFRVSVMLVKSAVFLVMTMYILVYSFGYCIEMVASNLCSWKEWCVGLHS